MQHNSRALRMGAIFVLTLFVLVCPMVGQEVYSLNIESSTTAVSGGSTLKDWKAEVETMSGDCVVRSDSIFAIESASMSFIAKSLDGGRGPDMNAKIYKALDAENHPQITFKADTVEVVNASPDNTLLVRTTGQLVIAGKSKSTTLELRGTKVPLALTGTHQLKFSDFEITPPSALFGQIVCDDEISIDLNLIFEK